MNQPQESLTTGSPSISKSTSSESVRPCLACGYALQGLGDEPRCPECGLPNIPEGYRRQVHELVDSGKWFFSSFFGFYCKRPPGWWWSLDRSGDVRRAVHFAAAAVLVSVLVVIGSGLVCGSIVRHETTVLIRPLSSGVRTGTEAWYHVQKSTLYLADANYGNESKLIQMPEGPPPSQIMSQSSNTFEFSTRALAGSLAVSGLMVGLWLIPASVGLSTQIRKSLPSFARPPRTIWAACLYESHRIIYAALVAVVLLAADAFIRCKGWTLMSQSTIFIWIIVSVVVAFLGMLGWIGPLRSDYTNQLIRSRKHGIRILLMYGLIFPLLIIGSVSLYCVTRGY